MTCPAIDTITNQACSAEPWSYDDLVNLLDPGTQRKYVQRLEGLLATVLLAERAVSGEAPLSPYRGSVGRRQRSHLPKSEPPAAPSLWEGSTSQPFDLKMSTCRQHIAEEILTLKCPRKGCRRAFLDFDGCFALTCPRCGCGFCAACIEDCGDDAHNHCRDVHYGVFGTLERFNDIQRKRRLVGVTEYLKWISQQESPAFVREVLESRGPVSQDLADVGIQVEEVKKVLNGGQIPSLDMNASIGLVSTPNHTNDQSWISRWLRRLLDGPGYAPEDDITSRLLGNITTGMLILAGVHGLVGSPSHDTDAPYAYGMWYFGRGMTKLFYGLMAAPPACLLLTGRGKQLLQSAHVAFLTAVVFLPLYYSVDLLPTLILYIIGILSVIAHIIGFLLDMLVECSRLAQLLLSELWTKPSQMSSFATNAFNRRSTLWPCYRRMVEDALFNIVNNLRSIGLLPPADIELRIATA